MNKTYYKVLGIGGIILGGLLIVWDFLETNDIYSLIGGGLWLWMSISMLQLLKENK